MSWNRAVFLGAILTLTLAVAALILDARSGGINLITEAFGVVCSTILTVAIIEYRRGVREAREIDARWRNRLRDELTQNVSVMLMRQSAGAIAPHQLLNRDIFDLSLDDVGPDQRIRISVEQATSLLLSMPLLIRPERLRHAAVDEVIAVGYFVRAAGGNLAPDPIHVALVQLRDDLERFDRNSRGSITEHEDWEARLVVDAGAARRDGGGTIHSVELLLALGLNDRLEDLFQSHVQVLRLLEGLDRAPQARRRPLSPFGERESHNVNAERVTPEEVARLVAADVAPVGSRRAAGLFGATREEQLARIAAALREKLVRDGVDENALYDEVLDRLAHMVLDGLATEGLEPIKRAE